MPSDHKEIVRSGYDAVSERYRADTDAPAEYEDWLRALTERIPAHADVLDLGCGCGVPMTRRLTDLRHQVLGVDSSRVQIDRARQLVPAARFIQADAFDLQFEPKSFDAIVCLFMLIHLPQHEQKTLVRRFRTWLRPQGVLVTTVGARALTSQEADWLGGGAPMWWSNPGADTYREWLATAGLTIEHDEFVPEGNGGHQLFIARVRRHGLRPNPAPLGDRRVRRGGDRGSAAVHGHVDSPLQERRREEQCSNKDRSATVVVDHFRPRRRGIASDPNPVDIEHVFE